MEISTAGFFMSCSGIQKELHIFWMMAALV
jgi:hypothetical protein